MRGIGGGEDAVGTGSEGGRSKNYEGGQDGLDEGLTCAGAWQVIFLLLFVAYFVIGVVSLAVDAEAMDATMAVETDVSVDARAMDADMDARAMGHGCPRGCCRVCRRECGHECRR